MGNEMSLSQARTILGVGRDAEKKEIQRRYRALAMKYHPDRNPNDAEAESSFKEAVVAKEILDDYLSKPIIEVDPSPSDLHDANSFGSMFAAHATAVRKESGRNVGKKSEPAWKKERRRGYQSSTDSSSLVLFNISDVFEYHFSHDLSRLSSIEKAESGKETLEGILQSSFQKNFGLDIKLSPDILPRAHQKFEGVSLGRVGSSLLYAQEILDTNRESPTNESVIVDFASILAKAKTIDTMVGAGSICKTILEPRLNKYTDFSLSKRLIFCEDLFEKVSTRWIGIGDIPSLGKLLRNAEWYVTRSVKRENSIEAREMTPCEMAYDMVPLISASLTEEFSFENAAELVGAMYGCLNPSMHPKVSRIDKPPHMPVLIDSLRKIRGKRGYDVTESIKLLEVAEQILTNSDTRIYSIQRFSYLASFLEDISTCIESKDLDTVKRFVEAVGYGARGYTNRNILDTTKAWSDSLNGSFEMYKVHPQLYLLAMAGLGELKYRLRDERVVDFRGLELVREKANLGVCIPVDVATYAGKILVEQALKEENPINTVADFGKLLEGFRLSKFHRRCPARFKDFSLTKTQEEAYFLLAEASKINRKIDGVTVGNKLQMRDVDTLIEIYFR